MLRHLKRLTKHSAVYGLGHIITRLVNFLLLPLYTHKLPTDDFGASQVVYAFIAVMTIIYTFGIDAAFLRYFILSDDKEKRRQVFSTAFWAIFSAVILFTFCTIYFSDWIGRLLISEGDYSNLIQLTGIILMFDALAFLPFLYLRAEEKSALYTLLKFVNVLINVALNVYLIVYLKRGVEAIFVANAWASGLTFVSLLYIIIKQISFKFNKDDFRALLKFGLPFLPSALSVVILDLIDRPILEKLAGLEATGIYSAGAKLGIFMALIVTAFRFAWHPFFLSTSRQENAKEIFARVLTYFTFICCFIFLLVSLFIDDIVRAKIFGVTIFGRQYWSATAVVPPILASYIFYGMYVNFMVGIYLQEKTKYLPFITFAGAAINIIANLILIPQIGIMGGAWSRLIGHATMCFMLLLFAQRFYKIDYEYFRLFKLGIVTVIAFFIGYNYHGAAELLIKFGIFAAAPVALFLIGFFEKREIITFKKLLTGKT